MISLIQHVIPIVLPFCSLLLIKKRIEDKRKQKKELVPSQEVVTILRLVSIACVLMGLIILSALLSPSQGYSSEWVGYLFALACLLIATIYLYITVREEVIIKS